MNLANEIIYQRIENVKQLLAEKADVNEIDDYGYTPLIEAAIVNNVEIATLLLKQGAKINATDLVGSTALHWAVENNNLALCQLLLEHGANANAYTSYSQPVLVKPLLRRQNELKELLYRYHADLKFAQDYIYTKLLGHRYELLGRVDIIDPSGKFIEVGFEGFILEFTISVVLDSLMQFKNNFAARNLRPYFDDLHHVIDSYLVANELVKYQQYLVKVDAHEEQINNLLQNELLLMPIGYEGHAITLIRYKDLFAYCDRGEYSLTHPSVTIYKVQNKRALTRDFFKYLLYQKQNKDFMQQGIIQELGLIPIASLPLSSQVSGNCSWANVEAALPAMLWMLWFEHNKLSPAQASEHEQVVLNIYQQWQEWDKERALHECIENFYSASPARKASIAASLAAVLFQRCHFDNLADLPKINKIMPILSLPEYNYILKSYIKIYAEQAKTAPGNNLLQLLDLAGHVEK